jgi:hypothetical protein
MKEFDWIFDFVLQFLESDKFDAAVMDFVDEKCIIFDSEEENKFIYTDIHRDFRDHVETLISSNLGELDISLEKFYESCVKGRHGRDINQAVFERLIAMDDFTTFKRLMVKRNMELQLEALRTFNATPYKSKDYYTNDGGDEERVGRTCESARGCSVAASDANPPRVCTSGICTLC